MMHRRHFLGTSLLAGLATQAFGATKEEDSFDFAFLTDIHVQPELGAPEGFRQCLRAVNALGTPADFVLTGGDLIFDALDVGMDRIREQWKVFDECSKELALPVHHTIGNHDVVGWSTKSPVKPTDQDYGKKLFAERFGLARTYRSFDHKGWHFIILDSIGQNKETLDYEGWIDEAQLDWLKKDLAATGRTKPIVMVTHIPFYTTWHQVMGDRTFTSTARPSSATCTRSGNYSTPIIFNSYSAAMVTSSNASRLVRSPTYKAAPSAACGGKVPSSASPRASARSPADATGRGHGSTVTLAGRPASKPLNPRRNSRRWRSRPAPTPPPRPAGAGPIYDDGPRFPACLPHDPIRDAYSGAT